LTLISRINSLVHGSNGAVDLILAIRVIHGKLFVRMIRGENFSAAEAP
jgi:hypothetical protein